MNIKHAMDDMGHDHGMGGMMMPPPPSSSSPSSSSSSSSHGMVHNTTTTTTMSSMMNMNHMSFYWGKNAEILFSGWPGSNSGGMYTLSLLVVFLLAFLVEWLSRSRLFAKPCPNDVVSGLFFTLFHTLRMGLSYLVMLSLMSFNGGVFLFVLAGHALGFLVFATRVLGPRPEFSEDPNLPPYQRTTDLH